MGRGMGHVLFSRRARQLRRHTHDGSARDAGFVVLDVLLGILVLALLLLTVLSSIGPYRTRAYVASATSDARQLGEKIQAQLTDNKSLADAGLPTTEEVLTEGQVSALGVNLTRGVVVSRYTPLSSTNFQVCVVHTTSGVIDAYALFDSTKGRVTTSGRGSGPAACAAAGAGGTLPTTSLPSGDSTGSPTGGPAPTTPTTPTDTSGGSGIATPTNVVTQSDPGTARATVTWDAVSGATSYAVYLDGASTPAWTGTALTTTLTGLAVGPHSVTVTALANSSESTNSPSSTFRIYGDNDFIANAHPLAPEKPGQSVFTADYNNTGKSAEAGEPTDSINGLWWKFTAERSTTYEIKVAAASDSTGPFSYPSLYVWESNATSVTDLPATPYRKQTGSGGTVGRISNMQVTQGKTYLIRISTASTSWVSKFRLQVTSGPSNDSLAGATVLTGLPLSDTSWFTPDLDNTYAGPEPGEPANSSGSMWWTMVAPRTAFYEVRVVAATDGTAPPQYQGLAAWATTTTDVTALGTARAEQYGSGGRPGILSFAASQGETIKIRISSAGWYGKHRLRITPGPANDSLVDAAPIAIYSAGSTWVSPDVDNTYAGPEIGEPSGGDGSMWWTLTAPTTGTYTFRVIKASDGSNFFTYPALRAWTTTSTDVTTLGAFTAGNTSSGGLNEYFSMPLTAGQTYKLRVNTANSYSTSYRTKYRLQVTN